MSSHVIKSVQFSLMLADITLSSIIMVVYYCQPMKMSGSLLSNIKKKNAIDPLLPTKNKEFAPDVLLPTKSK